VWWNEADGRVSILVGADDEVWDVAVAVPGQTKQLEKSAGGSVTAGTSPLFPWLKIGGAADARRMTSLGGQEGQSVVLEPVEPLDAAGAVDPARGLRRGRPGSPSAPAAGPRPAC